MLRTKEQREAEIQAATTLRATLKEFGLRLAVEKMSVIQATAARKLIRDALESHYQMLDREAEGVAQTTASLVNATALKDAAAWCDTQRSLLGAVDGYDYRSGEEYGLRRAQIELEKRSKGEESK